MDWMRWHNWHQSSITYTSSSCLSWTWTDLSKALFNTPTIWENNTSAIRSSNDAGTPQQSGYCL
jgi:hypothetical protein